MTTTPSPTSPASSHSPVRLSAAASAVSAYSPPALPMPVDLHLDANEGPAPALDPTRTLAALDPERLRRYAKPAALESLLAERFALTPDRVLVTAGGDEAIERACRIALEPGRDLLVATPTFEMIPRAARLLSAGVSTVPWTKDRFPIEAMLAAITPRTGLIAVVSPNNPTGGVASADDLRRLSAAAPSALLLVDLAYTEFAKVDLTPVALELPNSVIVRTFSKALGLAGLRVGYAMGPAAIIGAMRAVGLPYPVSVMSLAVAAERVGEIPPPAPPGAPSAAPIPAVAAVRHERDALSDLLASLGAAPRPSQANFVLAQFRDPVWVWTALASLGISVRRFPGTPGLDRALRITCPGNAEAFDRLTHALRAALKPAALLFDMDGVLADVSGSYRRAIALTAQSFGVAVTPADIAAAKARGNANNDWVLTQRLLAERGVDAPLAEVTARFEALYHGSSDAPGLEASERPLVARGLLERFAERVPLAIVTGRPRRDCERFLNRFGLADLFTTCVCMEDAPAKPDPAPVRLALTRLSMETAWLIGDTPDDLLASRRAGVVPIAIPAPGETPAAARQTLERAGAALVLDSLDTLETLLP